MASERDRRASARVDVVCSYLCTLQRALCWSEPDLAQCFSCHGPKDKIRVREQRGDEFADVRTIGRPRFGGIGKGSKIGMDQPVNDVSDGVLGTRCGIDRR